MKIDFIIPIQNCYNTPNGYIKCKTTSAKRLDGFHGGADWNLNGLSEYVKCPKSFVYFGLTCVNFNDGVQAMNFHDAELFCQGMNQ